MSRHRKPTFACMLMMTTVLVGLKPHPLAAQPTVSTTDKPPRILAHYMPWYEAKPQSATWGWHWTMNRFNPEDKKDGHPPIASHYHPLIGPYDSGDPDVLEYHALLMKLAGIDGVVIDWYGTVPYVDYGLNHRNCTSFVKQAARTGLEFAICFEDQTIPVLEKAGRLAAGNRVQHARNEIDWLREHWFGMPTYLKVGGRPILLSFGQSGLNDDEWDQVAGGPTSTFLYMSEHNRRKAAAGVFDWPSPRVGLSAQNEFFRKAAGWPVAMAVAYPRFHDIYEQAKVHESWGKIDDDNGKTFAVTLEKALRSGLSLIQISTWNDWGEGTVIEPSIEFGYRDLEVVQRMRRQFVEPGFAGKPEDLRFPLRLYKLRKSAREQPLLAREFERISQLISQRNGKAAAMALDAVGKPNGQKPF